MLIASQKEKENIAEYILYMWQMEDLIRGSKMNLEAVLDKIFAGNEDRLQKAEYAAWFDGVIEEMRRDNLTEKGHVKSVKTYMKSLDSLHHTLLTIYQDSDYIQLYNNASDHISDLRVKTKSDGLPETEVCLIGLYGFLVLKMQGKTISKETNAALKEMSSMLAYLAEAFNKLKKGELKLPSQMHN